MRVIKKFEYMMLQVNAKGLKKHKLETVAKMNQFGLAGWELVGMTGNVGLEGFTNMVFKREISQ